MDRRTSPPDRRYRFPAVSAVLLLCASACADDGPTAEPFIEDRAGDLPSQLSALRLYQGDPPSFLVASDAIEYRPAYELWSNGGAKERFLVLPEGATVDTTGERWAFPDGTFFFKTFSFHDEAGGERPVETRVMRIRDGEWEFAVYLWSDDGADAQLADITTPTEVEVGPEGDRFTHVVPSLRGCRTCHESQPGIVIGFDELRSNAPLADETETQLVRLHETGVLSGPAPESPERIEASDELTREVLGYLHGNCAHCHNGTAGPSTSFDMRHPVALENLVGRPTEGIGAPPGVRVEPGSPGESVLFQLFTATGDDQMPPLGVQRIDGAALDMLESWIRGLEP